MSTGICRARRACTRGRGGPAAGAVPFRRPTPRRPRATRRYRAAAALDVFGRFVWLATVVPPNAFGSSISAILPDYLTPVLALAELARRCVWGFFRLENEHISNAFMHRREGAFVPSHLRRVRRADAPKRALSLVEVVAIAALVVALLARMTVLGQVAALPWARRGDATANATATAANATLVYDDDRTHTHHHHHVEDRKKHLAFDDDDDTVAHVALTGSRRTDDDD